MVSSLPPQFRSGDVVRFGVGHGRLIDMSDDSWLEVKWDWPHVPMSARVAAPTGKQAKDKDR